MIAFARNPVQINDSTNSSKLKIVLIEDYGYYPDHVKAAFAGADACVWCVEKSTSRLSTD